MFFRLPPANLEETNKKYKAELEELRRTSCSNRDTIEKMRKEISDLTAHGSKWLQRSGSFYQHGIGVVKSSGSDVREPGFESCAAVLNLVKVCFTLHSFSSLSCVDEYLAINRAAFVH